MVGSVAIGWWQGLPGCGPDPLVVGVVLGLGSLYAAGVIRLDRSHRDVAPSPATWPVGRTIVFVAGLACFAIALFPPLDCAADVSFFAHMTQHLVLTLVAPPLLAMGAPVTLMLRALPRNRSRALALAMRSPVVAMLSHPVVGWVLFVGVPVAVHASSLFDLAVRSVPWHAFEHLLWVAAALIYWWPIVGADPGPHAVAYPVRVLSLVLAMPAMSFLALAIYSADSPLYPAYARLPQPWGGDALASQRDAATLMWLAGNLVLVVAVLLVVGSWKRHDDRVQRRREALQDAI